MQKTKINQCESLGLIVYLKLIGVDACLGV